jgi:hypothetical protein
MEVCADVVRQVLRLAFPAAAITEVLTHRTPPRSSPCRCWRIEQERFFEWRRVEFCDEG